jgi:hypothetical protein
MKIKMVETRRGSEDGFEVRQYQKGQAYDVAHTLATQFLNRGWAYNMEEEPAEDKLHSILHGIAHANTDFDRIFRPRPTRGCGSQNPATLLAKGEVL